LQYKPVFTAACLSGIHDTEVGWKICIWVRSCAGMMQVEVKYKQVHWVLFSYTLFLN